MKPLRRGDRGYQVRRWQTFLRRTGFYQGSLDGDFGPVTERATREFQKEQGLPDDAEVDPSDSGRARRMALQLAIQQVRARPQPEAVSPRQKKWFALGPHQQGDIRLLRPYFLVPMDPGYEEIRRETVVPAVAAWSEQAQPTDVFVMSHGWHRNLASAVAAYDRLSYRIAALLGRARLFPRIPFRPLFLNLHWHSDPGEDRWIDPAGRRHKSRFLELAQSRFEPRLPLPAGIAEPNFDNDFEDLFELFSTMSAPGMDALSADELTQLAQAMPPRLLAYRLRSTAQHHPGEPTEAELAAERAVLVAGAWACYHEAKSQRVLLDQDEAPRQSITAGEALRTFFGFLLGLVVLAMLLGAVGMRFHHHTAWFWVNHFLHHGFQEVGGDEIDHGVPWFVWLAWFFSSGVLGLGYLAGVAAWAEMRRITEPSASLARFGTAATLLWISWGLSLAVCAVPLLLQVLGTYFLGAFGIRWHLTDERIGKRDQPFVPTEAVGGPALDPRYLQPWWARLARAPGYLMLLALPPDHTHRAMVEGVDAQLAFWQMQQLGVRTGDHAGCFIGQLVTEVPALKGARFHFLGHSFGSLVVGNAVRRIALDERCRDVDVWSLGFLQGAIASDWLVGEKTLRKRVRGSIACVYSRYDTANGFFYPGGNQGRCAAGYLGLFGGDPARGDHFEPEVTGGYPALVRPPSLVRADDPAPGILNLDASRLIYEGSPLAGGGHGDIYKDDVIHLIWAALGLVSREK